MASITIEEPEEGSTQPSTVHVEGSYALDKQVLVPKVKCDLAHPNGNTYSAGPFTAQDPENQTWSCDIADVPDTPTFPRTQFARLTADLLDEDGTTPIATPAGPINIQIAGSS